MFGTPEHWKRYDDGSVTLRYEIGIVTGTEIAVRDGKVWLTQQTIAGDNGSVARLASLLHEASAIATLQRIVP